MKRRGWSALDFAVVIGVLARAGRIVNLQLITRDGRDLIELLNLPCHVARELDAKLDDGDFARGNVRASAASCTIGGDNDPVPALVVALPA